MRIVFLVSAFGVAAPAVSVLHGYQKQRNKVVPGTNAFDAMLTDAFLQHFPESEQPVDIILHRCTGDSVVREYFFAENVFGYST